MRYASAAFFMSRAARFRQKGSTITVMSTNINTSPLSTSLPRSSPEAQGISSAAIQVFVQAADQQIDTMHSFMLVRHGHVVAEGWWHPHSPATPHILHSLTKSFTSTAVGLAIAEGKFDLNTEILRFFPEDAPAEPSDHLKAMRVRDLLCMATGQETEPKMAEAVGTPWTRTFLTHPVPHKPGRHFLYNSGASYMLSALVQKVTGQTMLDFLGPRLFAPLGIEPPTWETSPQGITIGGWGLWLRTEDIAKFGQLYLQRGMWEGTPIIPASWVDLATSRQMSTWRWRSSEWTQGYGYQFWRCRHGAYRADGAAGQYCIVLPKQDAVVALTADTNHLQEELGLVWSHLLPAMKPAPLPEDPAAWNRLKQTLSHLVAGKPSR